VYDNTLASPAISRGNFGVLKAEISKAASGIGSIEARLDRADSVIGSGRIEEWLRRTGKLEANRPGKNGS
jgi:hypothetical protein